jgi:hypothetical protein
MKTIIFPLVFTSFVSTTIFASVSHPSDTTLYYIVSEIGNKVLTVTAGNSNPGGLLEIRDLDENNINNQLFSLFEINNGRIVQTSEPHEEIPTYGMSNKLYFIRHLHGNVLDLKNYNTTNGATIQLWSFGGHAAHLWELRDAGDGYFYIINFFSGKAIDVAGGRNENGNKVHSFELNKSAAQRWKFQKAQNIKKDRMINGEPTLINSEYVFRSEKVNLQTTSLTFIPQKSVEWDYIVKHQMGVAARNRTNNYIGWCPAEWGASRNNWFPQANKKFTVCGNLCSIGAYKSGSIGTGLTSTPSGGVPDEHDLNLHLVPKNQYWYVTDERVIDYTNPTGAFDFLEGVPIVSAIAGAEELLTGNCIENWHKCPDGYTIEGEVTADEEFINLNNLFINYKDKVESVVLPGQTNPVNITSYSAESRMFINRDLCMYGPYVTEVNHCNKPEIHPSEMLWGNGLTENTKHLIMLQDDSDRFHVKSRFDSDNCDWNPWVTPTLSGEFYIPFELDGTKKYTYEITVEMSHEIKTSYFASNIDASEYSGRSKVIESKGKTLLEVIEKQQNPNDIATRFEIFRASDNAVRGYLVVSAAVGEDLNGKEGFLIISVTKKSKTHRGVPIAIGTLPILEN